MFKKRPNDNENTRSSYCSLLKSVFTEPFWNYIVFLTGCHQVVTAQDLIVHFSIHGQKHRSIEWKKAAVNCE